MEPMIFCARAVEDQSGPIPGRERASLEGSFISFDARTLELIQATLLRVSRASVGSPRSRTGVLLAQIVPGILKTMGGTTCARMSICRATACHRLESNTQRGEGEIVPAKRKPLIIHSAFEYAISRGQVPGVGEIVTKRIRVRHEY